MATPPILLDHQSWDLSVLKRACSDSSLPGLLRRQRVIESLGPSALLGLAAVATSSDAPTATQTVMAEFGLSAGTAKDIVKVGSILSSARDVNNDPIGYLAGVRLTAAQRTRIFTTLETAAAATGSVPAEGLNLSMAAARASWESGKFRRFVLNAARTGDLTVMQVAAAVTAGLRSHDPASFAAKLTGYQTYPLATGRNTKLAQRANDILSAAYALTAYDRGGLDLGAMRWKGAQATWRAAGAAWVYPLLDSTNGQPVADLLDAVHDRGLKFAAPGTSPFVFNDSTPELDDARLRVQTFSGQLTKWLDRPWWFDGGKGQVQVLVTQDENRYMYAWVGSGGVGVLVAFDLVDLVPYGNDVSGVRAALALALGWYLDGSISLRKSATGTSTVTRVSAGTKQAGAHYVPKPSFATQVSDVSTGTHAPPRLHGVVAHLRTYNNGYTPSIAARQNAPARLRTSMKSNQTFVRSHTKGQGNLVALENRLSNHSALADAIAGLQRRTP